MEIINRRKKPVQTVVFDTYWKFAAERQKVFFNRVKGDKILTEDPIISRHRFTNVYRASDRVSQYLIKKIIYSEETFSKDDLLLRILLFKIFNKISTWELIESELGKISVETFDFNKIRKLLTEARKSGESIYSGAYIMTSGKSIFGYDYKHENHLKLLEKYIIESDFSSKIQESKSLEDLYNTLLQLPTIGTFLAFQYAIDINYSPLTNFSEMDFVKAGPGAKDGITKCFSDFGDYSHEDIIKYMVDNQEKFFDQFELDFQSLWGRRLQLIDCQNIFCEVDKYSRVAHPEILGLSERTRIKQIYKPQESKIDYFFPPKWNLNSALSIDLNCELGVNH